jgi:hypothetical protein
MSTGYWFLEGKAAGTWSWKLRLVPRPGMVDLYLHSFLCLHGIVLNTLSTELFTFTFLFLMMTVRGRNISQSWVKKYYLRYNLTRRNLIVLQSNVFPSNSTLFPSYLSWTEHRCCNGPPLRYMSSCPPFPATSSTHPLCLPIAGSVEAFQQQFLKSFSLSLPENKGIPWINKWRERETERETGRNSVMRRDWEECGV